MWDGYRLGQRASSDRVDGAGSLFAAPASMITDDTRNELSLELATCKTLAKQKARVPVPEITLLLRAINNG